MCICYLRVYYNASIVSWGRRFACYLIISLGILFISQTCSSFNKFSLTSLLTWLDLIAEVVWGIVGWCKLSEGFASENRQEKKCCSFWVSPLDHPDYFGSSLPQFCVNFVFVACGNLLIIMTPATKVYGWIVAILVKGAEYLRNELSDWTKRKGNLGRHLSSENLLDPIYGSYSFEGRISVLQYSSSLGSESPPGKPTLQPVSKEHFFN